MKCPEDKIAPVRSLDLRDTVVTGDALLARQELSLQIVQARGDYVWVITGNQPHLRQDTALLFEPQGLWPSIEGLWHSKYLRQSALALGGASYHVEQRAEGLPGVALGRASVQVGAHP